MPTRQIIANINLDGLNVYGLTQNMVALGTEHSTLKNIVEGVARAHNLTLSPDDRPEQGYFFRSDHFPFAKAGIPAVSIRTGQEFVGRPQGWGAEQFRLYNTTDYHQPSDEYRDNWYLRGLLQQAQVSLEIGRRVADGAERPRYNEGDEFAQARR